MPENIIQHNLSFADSQSFEKYLIESEVSRFCGTDEAGRGPLAGPVVAAAVMYDDLPILLECRDSKSLLPARRAELFDQLIQETDYAVGICTAGEIDSLNILRASLEAMCRAVKGLASRPECILVDGPHSLPIPARSIAIVKGDARVAVISAASIIAKVTRDRMMQEYEAEFPGYGFGRHFGYPTLEHRLALKQYGPCLIHRKSYRGVRELDS